MVAQKLDRVRLSEASGCHGCHGCFVSGGESCAEPGGCRDVTREKEEVKKAAEIFYLLKLAPESCGVGPDFVELSLFVESTAASSSRWGH